MKALDVLPVPNNELDQAYLWKNIGHTYRLQKQFGLATEAFAKAQAAYECIGEENVEVILFSARIYLEQLPIDLAVPTLGLDNSFNILYVKYLFLLLVHFHFYSFLELPQILGQRKKHKTSQNHSTQCWERHWNCTSQPNKRHRNAKTLKTKLKPYCTILIA